MELADLDLSKTYSYADYYQWTFDDRVELFKGKVLEYGPTPGTLHNRLSSHLSARLYAYAQPKKYFVFRAPFDVRLLPASMDDKDNLTVVQPDLGVICDRTKIDERGGIGAPDILVEILSPGDNRKELKIKYEIYEEAGVLEYWIIFPSEMTFLRYILTNGHFQASRPLTLGDEVTTDILPGFALNLDELFAERNY